MARRQIYWKGFVSLQDRYNHSCTNKRLILTCQGKPEANVANTHKKSMIHVLVNKVTVKIIKRSKYSIYN